jgi:hypothetical protein
MASAGTSQRLSAVQAVKDAVAAIAPPMVIGLEISEALTAQDEAAVSGIARDVFLNVEPNLLDDGIDRRDGEALLPVTAGWC